jgi:GTPase SAR1 family protein
MSTPLLNFALELDRANLCVIPIKPDGSKSPSVPSWKNYQRRKPTLLELQSWFGGKYQPGFAIIAGKVSDNLEIIDFDEPNLAGEFVNMVEAEAPGLIITLPTVQTPTGGFHFFYRCAVIEGNQKLAQAEVDGKVETLIETRGEGGYVLTINSPLACHPSGKPYTLINGDLASIPTITEQERAVLLDCARSFNQVFKTHQRINPVPAPTNGHLTPGQRFNQSGKVRDLLERHGWKYLRPGPNGELWARPGVDHTSATLYPDGGLYVFSSNAAPLDAGRVYSPFSLYGILEHSGDFKAAAKTLGQYLDQSEEIELEIEDTDTPTVANAGAQQAAGQVLPSDALDSDPEPLLGAQTVEALMNTIFPTPKPILRGLYKGDWGLVVGIGSVGKTTFMNGLVTAITSGRAYEPFLPFGAEAKRVLYLDFESNGFRLQKQLRAIQSQLTPEELAATNQNFFIVLEPEIDGKPFKLTDVQSLRNLAKFAKDKQIDLIVIDTLSQASNLNNENDNSEVQNKVVTPMRRLAKYADVAILLLHHEGKRKPEVGEHNQQYRMRGASALIDGARYSVTIMPQDMSKKNGLVTVSNSKEKGDQFPTVTMKLNPETRWFDVIDQPVQPQLEQLIVELLEQLGEMQTKEIVEAFPAYNRATIYRKLKELAQFGTVTKTKHGAYRPNFNLLSESETDDSDQATDAPESETEAPTEAAAPPQT